MQVFNWPNLGIAQRADALSRPQALMDAELIASVSAIMSDVRERGDAALFDLTAKYDGASLSTLRVPVRDLEQAWDGLDAADKIAMQMAKDNICAFHSAQRPAVIELEVMPGVTCRREPRALDSAGLYVPGGTAPLVSTMISPCPQKSPASRAASSPRRRPKPAL